MGPPCFQTVFWEISESVEAVVEMFRPLRGRTILLRAYPRAAFEALPGPPSFPSRGPCGDIRAALEAPFDWNGRVLGIQTRRRTEIPSAPKLPNRVGWGRKRNGVGAPEPLRVQTRLTTTLAEAPQALAQYELPLATSGPLPLKRMKWDIHRPPQPIDYFPGD